MFSLKGTMGDKIGCLFYLSRVSQWFTCALHWLIPCRWHTSRPTLFSWLIVRIITMYLRHFPVPTGNSNFIAMPSIHLQVFQPEAYTHISHSNSRRIPHFSSLKTLCFYHTIVFDYPKIQSTICHPWTLSHAVSYLPFLLQNYNLRSFPQMPSLNKGFSELAMTLLWASMIPGCSFVALISFYSMDTWACISWHLSVTGNRELKLAMTTKYLTEKSWSGKTSSMGKEELEGQISITLQFFHSDFLHVLVTSSELASFIAGKLAAGSNHNFLLHMWQTAEIISHKNWKKKYCIPANWPYFPRIPLTKDISCTNWFIDV